ncbi:YecH family metal-binding protein [Corallincola platygyrae]|uniref:YecH family metal-binding protein n=1 Tax=Corallincola platygyrae TaxID=1193278 RepID=A0ABW4XPI1_9GAMM
MASIHGHQVLELILSSAANQTLSELRKLITSTFGEEAEYHTCSAEGMNVDTLLEFLVARGKIAGEANKLNVDPSKICNH